MTAHAATLHTFLPSLAILYYAAGLLWFAAIFAWTDVLGQVGFDALDRHNREAVAWVAILSIVWPALVFAVIIEWLEGKLRGVRHDCH